MFIKADYDWNRVEILIFNLLKPLNYSIYVSFWLSFESKYGPLHFSLLNLIENFPRQYITFNVEIHRFAFKNLIEKITSYTHGWLITDELSGFLCLDTPKCIWIVLCNCLSCSNSRKNPKVCTYAQLCPALCDSVDCSLP